VEVRGAPSTPAAAPCSQGSSTGTCTPARPWPQPRRRARAARLAARAHLALRGGARRRVDARLGRPDLPRAASPRGHPRSTWARCATTTRSSSRPATRAFRLVGGKCMMDAGQGVPRGPARDDPGLHRREPAPARRLARRRERAACATPSRRASSSRAPRSCCAGVASSRGARRPHSHPRFREPLGVRRGAREDRPRQRGLLQPSWGCWVRTRRWRTACG
jgi:hypothetical protein